MEIELYHQFLLSVARSPTVIQYTFLYSTISTFRTDHSTLTLTMSTKQQREIDHSVYKQDLKRREVKVRFSLVTVKLTKLTYTISNYLTHTRIHSIHTHTF